MVWRGDNVGAGAGRVRRNSSYSALLLSCRGAAIEASSWRPDLVDVLVVAVVAGPASLVALRAVAGRGHAAATGWRRRCLVNGQLRCLTCASVRWRNSSLGAPYETGTRVHSTPPFVCWHSKNHR